MSPLALEAGSLSPPCASTGLPICTWEGGMPEGSIRAILDAIPAMYVVTRDTPAGPVIEDCNELFLDGVCRARHDVVGRRLSEFYSPVSAARMAEGGYRRALNDVFAPEERQLVRSDGSMLDALLQTLPRRDAEGRPIGTHAVYIDITAQKRAEREMRIQVSLQRLRNGILRMESERDWEGVATAFQEELRAFIAYSRWSINVVDRRTGKVTLYFHTDEAVLRKRVIDDVPGPILRALDSGAHVYRRNRQELREAGDNPWFLEHGYQSILDVPFSSGTVAVSSQQEDAFTAQDISVLTQFAQVITEAQRRVEDMKALTYKEQQLRQAQKLEMIGQLGAGVAHEINNPLTVVLGQSELLLREAMAAEHLESVRQIHKSAERARVIAERLLLFSRRQKTERQWVGLNPLVRETLEMMRYQFSVRNVQLVEELSEEIPQIEVHSGQIQQVVLNLIQNSRDAIREQKQEGTVWVRTYRQRDWVVLEVEDDGPGIAPGLEEKIFEPFFTTKEPGEGTGLGLSVCHGIARDHGGHLYAKKCERGACMVLKLPVGSARL